MAPSRLVRELSVSETALPPPRKFSTPPRLEKARSAAVATTLVVPPKRLLRTLTLLSSVSTAPSERLVVTKPTLAVALLSVTVPPLSWSVPRMFAELSSPRFQLPVPILVTLSTPEV